jgi:predicted lipoprotein with Yx(FWY)xxD motif
MFGSQGPAAGARGGVSGGIARPGRAASSGAIAACAALALSAAALAAAGAGPALRASTNAALGKTIVVDTHGRTIYALSPETVRHLLCKSKICFADWPPVTVPSRAVKLKAGPGVEGRLALIRRSDGKLQVTLRGMPLYTFSRDTSKGEANGEGIKAFGGTWHALVAAASHAGTQTPNTARGPANANGPAPTSSPSPTSSPTPTSSTPSGSSPTSTSTMTTTATTSTQSTTSSSYYY